MDRIVIRAFGFIVVVTTIIAVTSIAWFGTEGHLANTPGEFGDSGEMRSVWILLVIPALLFVVGLCCAVMVNWPHFGELSPDAQRSLERYRSTVRRFFIGVGVLVAMVQMLVVARTAGLVMPIDFDTRAFYFGFGALLAYAGNVIPKIPHTSDKWFTATEFARFNRFGGWIFASGGILMCLSALAVPIWNLQSVTQILIYAVIGLPVLNGILILVQSRISRRT